MSDFEERLRKRYGHLIAHRGGTSSNPADYNPGSLGHALYWELKAAFDPSYVEFIIINEASPFGARVTIGTHTGYRQTESSSDYSGLRDCALSLARRFSTSLRVTVLRGDWNRYQLGIADSEEVHKLFNGSWHNRNTRVGVIPHEDFTFLFVADSSLFPGFEVKADRSNVDRFYAAHRSPTANVPLQDLRIAAKGHEEEFDLLVKRAELHAFANYKHFKKGTAVAAQLPASPVRDTREWVAWMEFRHELTTDPINWHRHPKGNAQLSVLQACSKLGDSFDPDIAEQWADFWIAYREGQW